VHSGIVKGTVHVKAAGKVHILLWNTRLSSTKATVNIFEYRASLFISGTEMCSLPSFRIINQDLFSSQGH